MADPTSHTFFNGRVKIQQDVKGYRFSIDAVLLAGHVKPRRGERIVDLGTGCGVIPLILSYRYPGIRIYGVEVQKDLAEMAAANVAENNRDDRITILCRDMKSLTQKDFSGPVDSVVTNPPYRKVGSGRINPNRQRAIAKHEITVTLYDVVATARRILRVHGKFITIYPAERLTDIAAQMRSLKIEPKLIRPIYSRQGRAAERILVEGIKEGRHHVQVGPPLTICRENGSYSEEVLKLYQP